MHLRNASELRPSMDVNISTYSIFNSFMPRRRAEGNDDTNDLELE